MPRATPPPPKVEELLTITDAAERMAVSRDTVERLLRQGELATVRVGTRRRVPADSLADYIERNRTR